jgi:uncharacterized protein (TIGR02145 family)
MKIRNELLISQSLIVLVFLLGALTLCAQNFQDIDGNVYKVVKIGPNTWAGSNLDVSRFRNGDIIPEVTTDSAWALAGKNGAPAWCYYENDTVNGKKYGKLYNWFAVTDPRGIAPAGWRIPTTEDWRTVSATLGGIDITGAKLKSTAGWKIKELATNKSGFSGLPAGTRSESGKFKDINNKSHWWSTSPDSYSKLVYSLMVADSSPELLYIKIDKACGVSVRCVKEH